MKKNQAAVKYIILKTNNNQSAIKVLCFFILAVSDVSEHIKIEYESCEQVSSICRLLVEENIDIREIYTIPKLK